MSKSKLMGIFVEEEKVDQAASKIGCVTLMTPFSYLGSKVGGLMSRIQSWNEIVDFMVVRLSKWKMKTLLIGGRLTLLKLVLWSMPIYHMSIFKVPMKVLQRMESIRCYFFSGADLYGKKSIWVKWNNVLWFIKAIYGDDGKIGKNSKSAYPYIWLDIVHEMELFKKQGIDVYSYIHKKLENGAHTAFWEDVWRDNVAFKHRGGVEQTQFADLLIKVEGVSLVNMNDRWVWSLEGSGDFSVASVRKLIDDKRLPEVSSKTRWIKLVLIKYILCPICDNAMESSRHIFFNFHVVREILQKITCWWDVSYTEVSSYEEWLAWILNLRLSVKHNRLLEGVCYSMW
ncbi:hypothetical protein Tco_1177709 [Tanacetum coccineum]